MRKMRVKYLFFALLTCAILLIAVAVALVAGYFKENTPNNPHENSVTLTFETFGGSEIPTVVGKTGEPVSVPVPSKDGFRFMGWYADENFSESVELPKSIPARNKTFYAKFLPLYSVRFLDSDGVEIFSFEGIEGETITVVTPSRDGFSFEGWFAEKDLLTSVNIPLEVPAENLLFYAKFLKIVTVCVLDEQSSQLAVYEGKEGEPLGVKEPTKEGYVFAGWFEDENRTVSACVPEVYPKENICLYAAFDKLYSLKVLSGSDVLISNMLPAGAPVFVSIPTPEGYLFTGWFTDETLENEAVLPEKMPAADFTIYARFSKLYTLSFETYGGTVIPTIVAVAGTEFSVIEPKKEGYQFGGWYLDDGFTMEAEIPQKVPAEDRTYHAQFLKLYTLSFETFGGASIPSVVAVAGTAVTISDPEKEDCEFEGWFEDEIFLTPCEVPARMPERDLKLYAKFAALYRAVFEADGEIVSVITGKVGTSINPPADSPTKLGFTFIGWAEKGLGNDVVSFPAWMREGGVYYAAFYIKNPYLEFRANPPEGENAEGETPKIEGVGGVENSAHALNFYTVSDYRFAGWAIEPNGTIIYQDGETVKFGNDLILYARWAKGYSTEVGTVYYLDDEACQPALKTASGVILGRTQRNLLDETELVFSVDGREIYGEILDNKFVLRNETEYGIYTSERAEETGLLFLSGYGTAMLTKDGKADKGKYGVSMGNLLYFKGDALSGSYQIHFEKKTYLSIDNERAHGTYFNANLYAFELGGSATLGDRTCVYVAGTDGISFYFDGVETRAKYVDGNTRCFLYEGEVYYLMSERTVFRNGSDTFTFLPKAADYSTDAVYESGGNKIAGTLTVNRTGEVPFLFASGDEMNYEERTLGFHLGGGVPQFSVIKTVTRTVLINENGYVGANGVGRLCYETVTTYGEGETTTATLKGVYCANEDGEYFYYDDSAAPVPMPQTLAFEKTDEEGVRYVFTLKTSGRNSYSCAWYGLYEKAFTDGEFALDLVQYAGSFGVAEYEGNKIGDELHYVVRHGQNPLDLTFALNENGRDVYLVLLGEHKGRYHVGLERTLRGLITGFSCDVYPISEYENKTLSYENVNGELRFLSLLTRDENEYVASPILSNEAEGDYRKLTFGTSETKESYLLNTDFAFAPCQSYSLSTDLGYEVETECCVPFSYALSVTIKGAGEHTGAAVRNGEKWEIVGEFSTLTLALSFSETKLSARSELVYKEFSLTGVANKEETQIFFTRIDGNRVKEVLRAAKGERNLTVKAVEPYSYGGENTLLVTLFDEENSRNEEWFLLPTSQSFVAVKRCEVVLETQAKFTILYFSDGSWYEVLKTAELYNAAKGVYEVCNGEILGDGDVWVWKYGEMRVSLHVEKTTDLRMPYAISSSDLPVSVASADKKATAQVYDTKAGVLKIYSFVKDGADCTAAAQYTSPMDGVYYFEALGYLLKSDENGLRLLACSGEETLSADDYKVTFVTINGSEVLPIRFSVSGSLLTGKFEGASDIWKFQSASSVYTFARGRYEDGSACLCVFAGNYELCRITFDLNDGRAYFRFAPKNGSYTLPTPQRDGYNFQHWLDKQNRAEYSAGETISLGGELTLVAVWEEIILGTPLPLYSGYNEDDYTVWEPYSEMAYVLDDNTVQFPENPTREGYTFDWWYIVISGEALMEFDEETFATDAEYRNSIEGFAASWIRNA